MRRYKIVLSYDGTRYFGWQKTKMGPSIQETLEKTIYQLTQEKIAPEAASRTDRGVHAEGQTASFVLTREREPKSLQRGLNALLPMDIRVITVEQVALHFHPTLHTIEKEYRYHLCLGTVQEPMYHRYSWAFRYPLNLLSIEHAAKDLLGTHDFSALTNKSNGVQNRICTLHRIEITSLPDQRLQIAIIGNRFLYKMVRNIVGTLLYIDCGKLPKDHIPILLASKDRTKAGITAPAHGLTLYRVSYIR